MTTQLLGQFVALLAIHYVGDFIVQTHWQASNKSKRMDALLRHVFITLLTKEHRHYDLIWRGYRIYWVWRFTERRVER